MLIIAMFAGVLFANQLVGIAYKTFSVVSADNRKATPVFMSLWTGVLGIALVLAALALNQSFAPTTVTWVSALVGGLGITAAGMLFIYILNIGSFIWSSLMMNLSSFVPVIFSLIFLGETISLPQIAGVLTILLILFVMSVKSKSGDRPFTKTWMILALIMMVANGGIFCAQKTQTHFMEGAQIIEFLALKFLFTSLFALVYHLFTRNREPKPVQLRPILPLALGMAIAIGVTNLSGMALMQYVTAAVQFPIVVGGGIVLTAIVGIKLYHEKPNWRLYLSASLLVVGVVLLGIG